MSTFPLTSIPVGQEDLHTFNILCKQSSVLFFFFFWRGKKKTCCGFPKGKSEKVKTVRSNLICILATVSPNCYFFCCLRKCKDIQFWRPSLQRVFKSKGRSRVDWSQRARKDSGAQAIEGREREKLKLEDSKRRKRGHLFRTERGKEQKIMWQSQAGNLPRPSEKRLKRIKVKLKVKHVKGNEY